MENIVVRFAPSPTGDPHIGNMRTALFTWLWARHNNGKFLLRIEDTDKTREVPGSIDRIKESLDWLGLSYDGEPVLQSSRLERYNSAAQELINQGNAYYCFCTAERLTQVREEQVRRGQPPMYDKHCRNIDSAAAAKRAETEPYVIRLKVPESGETKVQDFLRGTITFANNTIDDQVLIKSDKYPTYHLAVVVDDHDFLISHVMRGEDWIPSAPKHVLLYQFFNWPMPIFLHLPLIVGTDRKKLSKRLGDMSLLAYKREGYHHMAVLNFLARLGYSPKDDRKLYTLEELAGEFTLEGIHKNPAIFDLEKLQWFNRLVKESSTSETEVTTVITNLLVEHGVIENPPTESQYNFVKEAEKRIDTVQVAEETLHYLWEGIVTPAFNLLTSAHSSAERKALIEGLIDKLSGLPTWDEPSIGNTLREHAKTQTEWASKDFYQLITAVVTGSINSPPLFGSLALLGKEKALERLRFAAASLA